jgi:hypothetical protein
MVADFEGSALIKHRGSKGTLRESGLRDLYLKRYLPGTVSAVGSGEVVATDGSVSGQQDVMIVDPSTPPLFARDDFQVVPVECLHGVIEVKSHLSVSELQRSWATIRRIKSMPKSAILESPMGLSRAAYGNIYSYMPTAGMVFAYDGAAIETLGQAMAELTAQEPDLWLRLDSVWVLNKGYLVWRDHETGVVNAQADPGDDLCSFHATPEQVLMALTAHLHRIYGQACMNPFNVNAYLDGPIGEAGLLWSEHDGPGLYMHDNEKASGVAD